MPNKATPVRIEPTLQHGLETLSRVLKRPMKQLVNEALRDYVSRRSSAVEQDLKETLTALRAYPRRDPHGKESIAAVAEAEAQFGHTDPLDGEVLVGDLVDGQFVAAADPVASSTTPPATAPRSGSPSS